MKALKTVAIGRDIQDWLVRGLKALRGDSSVDLHELNATITLVERAVLVTLLVEPWSESTDSWKYE